MSEMTVHESDLTVDALKELSELKGQADGSTADFNRQAQEDSDRINNLHLRPTTMPEELRPEQFPRPDNLPPEVYIRPSYPEPTRMPEWYPKIEFKNREEEFGAMAARALSEKLGVDTAFMDPELFYKAADSFKSHHPDNFDLEYITRLYIELRTKGVPSFRISGADIDKAYVQVDRGLQQEATKKYQKPEDAFKEYYLSHAYKLTPAEFTLRFGHQIEAFPITPATELLDRTLMENRKADKAKSEAAGVSEPVIAVPVGSAKEQALRVLLDESAGDKKLADVMVEILVSQTDAKTDLSDVSAVAEKVLGAKQVSEILALQALLSEAVAGTEALDQAVFQDILRRLMRSDNLTAGERKEIQSRLNNCSNPKTRLPLMLLLHQSAKASRPPVTLPAAQP